jgi:hypothetical protein
MQQLLYHCSVGGVHTWLRIGLLHCYSSLLRRCVTLTLVLSTTTIITTKTLGKGSTSYMLQMYSITLPSLIAIEASAM